MNSHETDYLREPELELESPERRAFTLQAILALFSGVVITIGCGGDGYSGGSTTAPTTPSDAGTGSVSANHGHRAVIEAARLNAGGEIALDIRGTATHPHTVALSAQEVSQVAARQRVAKTSSTEDSPDAGVHSHTVTFN